MYAKHWWSIDNARKVMQDSCCENDIYVCVCRYVCYRFKTYHIMLCISVPFYQIILLLSLPYTILFSSSYSISFFSFYVYICICIMLVISIRILHCSNVEMCVYIYKSIINVETPLD